MGAHACDFFCSERFLSPVTVLSIHAAIVIDVCWHRPQMLELETYWVQGLWLNAFLTVTMYLQACTTDPGWLKRKSFSFSSPFECLLCPILPCFFSVGRCSSNRRKGLPITVSAATVGASVAELEPVVPDIPETAVDTPTGTEVDTAEGIQKRRAPIGASADDYDAKTPVTGSSEAQPAKYVPGDGAAERDLESNSLIVERRFCRKCHMYQPLRTKHCRDCGVCVRTHDHHCPWIGTCVGENNRAMFYLFLVCQGSELALFFVEGVRGISVREPSMLLLLGLFFIAIFFMMVSCLFTYHTFLLVVNLTTWEHNSWHKISYLKPYCQDNGSPFSRSFTLNLTMYFFGPHWCPDVTQKLTGLKREDTGCIEWEPAEPRGSCWLLRCCTDCC